MVVSSIGDSCNSLLQHIRDSGLNFSCQETPFSIYITVRKSYTQYRKENLASSLVNQVLHDVVKDEQQHPQEASLHYQSLQKKHGSLLAEKNKLEDTLDITKQHLNSALKECDLREEVIEELEEQKASQCELISNLENNVKSLEVSDKRKEALASENKTLKSDITELKGELKIAKKDVKTLNKESIKSEHDFGKRIDILESKIRNLMEFKAGKVAEERDAKTKEKTLLKKIKALEEDKAKVTIAKNKIERDLNQNKVSTDSKSSLTELLVNLEKESQTEASIDSPYDVKSPLPPIFSSNLCRITPPIKFLSRSLPNLSTILWVLPNTNYLDEAEEFLSQQHENMVKQMYRVKKEQAQTRKLEMTLNKYDLALISTKRVAEILDDDTFDENYMDLFHPCN